MVTWRGARWMQFRPTVIESSPGAGKTKLAHRLSELSGVPLIYLDCAAMSNLTPILGQDSSWSNSRASEIVEGLSGGSVANVVVVLDELDKLKDYGRNASPKPSEQLVGLLEKRSAAAHLDHFTQLTLDLSFILDYPDQRSPAAVAAAAGPLPGRPLASASGRNIAQIAAREIERRGLEPELVKPITQAVRSGRITSLRTLHKLLDAAAAASARPLLT